MSLAGIRIGEDYEDTRLHAVGDPAFAAIEHPVTAITHLGETLSESKLMSGSLLPVEISQVNFMLQCSAILSTSNHTSVIFS